MLGVGNCTRQRVKENVELVSFSSLKVYRLVKPVFQWLGTFASCVLSSSMLFIGVLANCIIARSSRTVYFYAIPDV